MKDIADFYLGEPNSHTGRYKCPFNHEEHNCNLEVKEKYWRCFSCGTSGDEIELVKQLFGIDDYKECLLKIAKDFGLKTTAEFDPEYEKKVKEFKRKREEEKRRAEKFERIWNKIFDKVCNRNHELYKIIIKTSPYNPKKLDKYALTKACDICARASYQYSKNEVLLDVLTCCDISDYDSAIYGYAVGLEEKNALKKQIVYDIINKKIKLSEKGDVISVYGYKI